MTKRRELTSDDVQKVLRTIRKYYENPEDPALSKAFLNICADVANTCRLIATHYGQEDYAARHHLSLRQNNPRIHGRRYNAGNMQYLFSENLDTSANLWRIHGYITLTFWGSSTYPAVDVVIHDHHRSLAADHTGLLVRPKENNIKLLFAALTSSRLREKVAALLEAELTIPSYRLYEHASRHQRVWGEVLNLHSFDRYLALGSKAPAGNRFSLILTKR